MFFVIFDCKNKTGILCSGLVYVAGGNWSTYICFILKLAATRAYHQQLYADILIPEFRSIFDERGHQLNAFRVVNDLDCDTLAA